MTPCTCRTTTRGWARTRGSRTPRSRSAATWCGWLPSVSYAGRGGDAELRGLYFADAGQHLEHRLFVDHTAPDCRSRVLYKGALQGDGAHAVWIGDVLIRRRGDRTDTYEYNRNLVLTDGARVDSVPNLEILTGEVAARGTPAPAAAWRTRTCST